MYNFYKIVEFLKNRTVWISFINFNTCIFKAEAKFKSISVQILDLMTYFSRDFINLRPLKNLCSDWEN